MFELFMDYNDAIIDSEFTAFCKEDKANDRLSIKMSPKKGRKSSFRPRISGVFLFVFPKLLVFTERIDICLTVDRLIR